jgi:hypothetical protein
MSEVIGKIRVINAVQQVSASFKKQEIVITTDSQYPQHIPIEFKQDKTDLLNNYKVGESVKVNTNLTGREWVNPSGETKYFLGLEGWRIEKLDTSKQSPEPAQQQSPPQATSNEEEPDDLPF